MPFVRLQLASQCLKIVQMNHTQIKHNLSGRFVEARWYCAYLARDAHVPRRLPFRVLFSYHELVRGFDFNKLPPSLLGGLFFS